MCSWLSESTENSRTCSDGRGQDALENTLLALWLTVASDHRLNSLRPREVSIIARVVGENRHQCLERLRRKPALVASGPDGPAVCGGLIGPYDAMPALVSIHP